MDHDVYMEGRSRITLTAVTGVDEFDSSAIIVNLKEENLIVCGKNLHIQELDLEEEKLIATGTIDSLLYTKRQERKSIFMRFRK